MSEIEAARIRIGARHADAIRAALSNSVDADATARHWHLIVEHMGDERIDSDRARAWAKTNVHVNTERLDKALIQTTRDGWVLGHRIAQQRLAHARRSRKAPAVHAETDWTNWKPGNPDAAMVARGRFQRLLAERSVMIKSVKSTLVYRLGTRLADSVNRGDNVAQTASTIRDVLSDPSHALMVAKTEMARVTVASELDSYREAGAEQLEYLVADPCDECQENLDASPISIDSDWPNGDPPVHPNCMCDVAPYVVAEDAVSPSPEDNAGDSGWGSGVGYDESMGMPYELNPTQLEFGWDASVGPNTDQATRDAIADRLRSGYQTVANSEVRIATPRNALESVINDRRYKSVHEIRPNDVGYLSYRNEIERDHMGIPSAIAANERPIYGFLAGGGDHGASSYGSVQAVLKDSVRDRVTMVMGDSFGGQNPVFLSDAATGNATLDQLARASNKLPWNDTWTVRDPAYWEVQIHGGVTLRDIDHFVMTQHEYDSLSGTAQQTLKDVGVNVVIQ